MQNFESPWVSAEPTSLEFMEAPAGFIRLRQLYSYPQWQRLSCKRLQHCAICIRSRSPIWTPIADKWYRYNDLIYHVSSQHGAVLSFYWDLYLTAASIDIGKEGMQDKDNSLVTFLEGNVMRERPISSLAQWQELSGKGHQTCRLCQKCTSIIWSRFRSSWHTGDALWYHMEVRILCRLEPQSFLRTDSITFRSNTGSDWPRTTWGTFRR